MSPLAPMHFRHCCKKNMPCLVHGSKEDERRRVDPQFEATPSQAELNLDWLAHRHMAVSEKMVVVLRY